MDNPFTSTGRTKHYIFFYIPMCLDYDFYKKNQVDFSYEHCLLEFIHGYSCGAGMPFVKGIPALKGFFTT
jgi:hypothetical protein